MWEEANDLAAGLREKSEFPRWTSLCPVLLLQDLAVVGVPGILTGEGDVTALPDQEENFLKVTWTCCSSLRAVTMPDLVRLSARAALNIK